MVLNEKIYPALMIRNDGKEIRVPFHTYGSKDLDEIEETLKASEWLFYNTEKAITKKTILKFIKSFISQFGTIDEFFEELEYLDNPLSEEFLSEISDELKNIDVVQNLKVLNDDVINQLNDEFLRARYGGIYDTEIGSKEMVFRVSSKNFNWFNIIWEFVYKHKNEISSVTIVKDYESLGSEDPYTHNGKNIYQMDVDEFINLSGNPIIESMESKNMKLDITNEIQRKVNKLPKSLSRDDLEDKIYWIIYDVLRDYKFLANDKEEMINDITQKELKRVLNECDLNEESELAKRAKHHRKRQKGLSPFGLSMLSNPVGGMEIFNNSTADTSTGVLENLNINEKSFNTIKNERVRLTPMNIKENLNKRDHETENNFDFVNLYESIKWTNESHNKLIESLKKNISNNKLYSFMLKEAYDEFYEDDEFEDNDGVSELQDFDCEGLEYQWQKRHGDVEHLDFDNWAVWEAWCYDTGELAYFVVDEDTGFIDWGPVETVEEAKEFLAGKVSDWEDEDTIDFIDYNEQLNEELWDSARVIDLVRYYLDRGNPPIDTLANLIMNQMKKEGSALPANTTDFFDKLYSAVNIYNAELDDNSLDECKNINEEIINIDEKTLTRQIKNATYDCVMNKLGYDEDFVNNWIIIDVENTKFTDSNDLAIKVEIRTELDYEEAGELAEVLNPIVAEYDPQAYFDHETSNTIVSYIRLDQSDDIVDNDFIDKVLPDIENANSREELLDIYRKIQALWQSEKITSGTAETILEKIANKVYALDEMLSKENDPNRKVELKKQIDELDDEIGDAIENDKMYQQSALIKKKQKLEENSENIENDDLGQVLYDDESDRMHIVTKDKTLNEECSVIKYNKINYFIYTDGDKIQITSSHPYDDAEYCWAKSNDSGNTFIIYRKGKQIEFFESESEDFSDILAEMDKLDKDIKPVMVHN